MSEDVYNKLLTALSASKNNGGETFREMLAELGEQNPKMKLITTYLAGQQAEETVEEEPPHLQMKKKKKRPLSQLRKKIDNMRMELEDLRERNDTLAAALGACYLCWGEDRECPECNGKGRPGFFTPDTELFTEFVAPALNRSQPGESPGRNHLPPEDPDTKSPKINNNKGEKNG